MTAKHTSDLDCCANCGRLLNDHEDWLCGPCLAAKIDAWYDPTDAELERRDALTARFWQHGWGAILFPLVCLVIAGTMMWGQNVHAQDERTITRTINDRPYTWTLPEAGCQFVRGWEDQSGLAWCSTGMHRYDPEDDAWYAVENTR